MYLQVLITNTTKPLDLMSTIYYNTFTLLFGEVKTMKTNIHPDYHTVKVECACGETFETKSTHKGDTMKIDICNKCHPFFTGKQKVVDIAGRVEKFNKRHNIDSENKEK